MSERRHKLWAMSTEECEWETEREKTLRLSLLHCVWLWRTRCLYKQSLFPLYLFISLFFVVSLCFAIFLPTCVLISCSCLILFTYFGSPCRFCSFLRCVHYSIVWFFIFLRRRCLVFVLFLVVFFLVSAILLLVRISGILVIFAGFFSSFLCGLCSTNIQCSLGGWRKEDAGSVATFSWFVYADCGLSSFFVPICVKWDQCCSVGGCDMGPSIKLFVWSLPIFLYSTFGSSFCSQVICLFLVDWLLCHCVAVPSWPRRPALGLLSLYLGCGNT